MMVQGRTLVVPGSHGAVLDVPPALRDVVASVRGQRSPHAPVQETSLVRLPTGASQLIVHVTPRGVVKASVSGPSTFAKYRLIVPGPFFVQLVFRADSARVVFGVPVSDLADRIVDLEELWGARANNVIDRVAARDDDPQAAVLAIEDLLVDRLRAMPKVSTRGATLAQRATEAIARAPTEANVRDLANSLGASERSLRDAFLSHVGVSPKRYARIARVLRVVAAAGSGSWARLAADHDFYDQAHLNAEFRALLGVSPSQYLAGRLPFVRPAAFASTA